jgi:MarR family transcriptional regulator, temperature-dependent positive regulator of motility
VLHYLEDNPHITQRELANKLGISLGAANFCLKALVEVGHIKINNFKVNPNKSAYFYLLTPHGIAEKTLLTKDFIKRKTSEYQRLKSEIDQIKSKIKVLD